MLIQLFEHPATMPYPRPLSTLAVLLSVILLSACASKAETIKPYDQGSELIFNQCKPRYVGNANRLPVAWENADYHKAVVTEKYSGDCYFIWGAQTRSHAIAQGLYACVLETRQFSACAIVAIDLNEYILSDYYKFNRSCDELAKSEQYLGQPGHRAIAMTSDSDHEYLYCHMSNPNIYFDNPFAAIMDALETCESSQGYACNVAAVNEETIISKEFGLANFERFTDTDFSEYYETQSGHRLDYLDRSIPIDFASRQAVLRTRPQAQSAR